MIDLPKEEEKEEEKEEDIRKMEEEEDEKDDGDDVGKLGDAGIAGIFNELLLEEDDAADKEEQKLLGFKKRKKKLKRLPLQINQKKSRKREPSNFQKIFDVLIKAEIINENTVKDAASKYKYELGEDNVNFFLELGKARSSLKKFGLPGDICKNPFHIYSFSKFNPSTSVITDDRVVWEAIYSQIYMDGGPYATIKQMFVNSTISSFSVITEKTFECKNAYSGYIQDFYKRIAIINSVPLDEDSVLALVTAFNNNNEGTYKKRCEFTSNEEVYNYYQYGNVILCGPQNLDISALAKLGIDMKCFNSKNNLSNGMKEIKVQDKIRTYINIHEVKNVDFSPSCLFTNPAIPEVSYFIDAKLDTNTVYNRIIDIIKNKGNLLELQFPENAVFWDNVGSFIQFIGLLAMNDNVSDMLKKQITTLVEMYYKNRDIFNSWKKIYKQFESIVLSFYDSVTTKLTIDGVTRLEKKVLQFISDYLFLRNDKSYTDIRAFFGSVPGVRLILAFISTSGPYEIVSSISKLITILRKGKAVKESKINDLFRTIGIMCTRVLFGGDFAMIPKVRSKAAFLGGPGNELTNETLKKNVQFLLDKFRADVKDRIKKDDIEKKLNYAEMDKIIDKMLENSTKGFGSEAVNKNLADIKKQIRSDEVIYKSLREDVEELYNNGESVEDMMVYGDFLDNPYFNSYLFAFQSTYNAFNNNLNKVDGSKLAGALKINPAAKMKRKGKKKMEKIIDKKPLGKELVYGKIVQIDNGKVGEIVENGGYQEGKEKKNLQEDINKMTGNYISGSAE